ncbi:MAG: hypothetical protein ACFB6R_12475 [Alphaproteobacteria bacterium]
MGLAGVGHVLVLGAAHLLPEPASKRETPRAPAAEPAITVDFVRVMPERPITAPDPADPAPDPVAEPAEGAEREAVTAPPLREAERDPIQGPKAAPRGPGTATPRPVQPRSNLSLLAGEDGLWSVVCQGLDPSLFGETLYCPDPDRWRAAAGLSQAGNGEAGEAGLIDPEAQMRAVLGPRYLDMSLADIHAAIAGQAFFDAPGLEALPKGAPEIGHLSSADSARDRLPPSRPDPILGN